MEIFKIFFLPYSSLEKSTYILKICYSWWYALNASLLTHQTKRQQSNKKVFLFYPHPVSICSFYHREWFGGVLLVVFFRCSFFFFFLPQGRNKCLCWSANQRPWDFSLIPPCPRKQTKKNANSLMWISSKIQLCTSWLGTINWWLTKVQLKQYWLLHIISS